MKILVNYDYKNIKDFGFDIEKISKSIIKKTLSIEKIDYDISLNISLISSAKIKHINRTERRIDKITDVLSFPNIPFEKPSKIKDFIDKKYVDVSIIDLVSNSIFLGDVVINKDIIKKNATKYGHSVKREYSFLLVHSLLHLLGYDHMNKNDEKIMFKKQDKILEELNILR